MQSFVVFATLLAAASAQFIGHPGYYNGFGYSGLGYSGLGYSGLGYAGINHPLTYAAAAPAVVAPAFSKTQYHAQDELGQSSHGYAYPGQAAAETRDAAGNVRGSYSYVDPNGKVVQTNYIADAVNGFRVESNALPVGPAAGPVHIAAIPAPVQDTPEVASAKIAHFAAVAEAQARSGRKRRGVAYTTGFPVAAHGYGYSALSYNTPLAYHTAVASPVAYHATSVAAPVTYAAAHPVAYHGLNYAHAPALTYAAAPAFRGAVLTIVVNNPVHAVRYFVY
jgi:hypothetical protein